MNIIRIVFGILMVIPLILLAEVTVINPESRFENPLLDVIYAAIGVPIVVINYWAWFHPEMIESFLFGRKRSRTK